METKPVNFTGAVLEKLKAPLVLHHEIEVPPLKAGQVLVRLFYSGICRSQLMEIGGGRGEDKYLPHFLGHEGTGEVVEVGPGVSKVRPGDKVILGWIKGEGLEGGPTTYNSRGVKINGGSVTTFSTHSVVSENRLVPLPPFLEADEGVLFGCALLTGAGITINEIDLNPESSLAVWGLGGIGMSAFLAAIALGGKNVVAIDVDENKLEIARQWGAHRAWNPAREDVPARLRELFPHGLDFSIEATGLASGIETAFRAVRKFGGVCVFASHPPSGETIRLDPYDLISGKTIRGSWGGACRPDRDVPKFAALFKEKGILLKGLLSQPYPLERINEALEAFSSGKVLRVLLRFQEG